MGGQHPDSYRIEVAEAPVIPACTIGSTLTLRIDGKPLPETAIIGENMRVDIVLDALPPSR